MRAGFVGGALWALWALWMCQGCATAGGRTEADPVGSGFAQRDACTVPAGEEALQKVALLCGSWEGVVDGRTIEERWTGPRSGMMLGTGREIGEGPGFFEFLQVTTSDSGEIVYRAWPAGQGPTEFKLVSDEGGKLVFENPDNEFPKRISYAQQPDGSLLVEISSDASRRKSWRLSRTAPADP